MPTPAHRPHARTREVNADEARAAVRRIVVLALLALGIGLLAGAFSGIVLFVAGLAALAAYAAAHPHHP
jgi:hypothetical protein